MFVLHAIMMNIWLYRNSIHTFCWFEFWVSYTRFLLNIEVSWNDQDFFVCFATEIFKLMYSLCFFLKTWKIVVIAIFASNMLTWEIIVIVIFASKFFDLKKSLWSWSSHRLFFSISNQFALKIWKSFSWMTQKKHDLMISLFVVFNIESLISYNSQFSIWWLTIDWMTKKSNFNSSFIFYSFCFLYVLKSMNYFEKND